MRHCHVVRSNAHVSLSMTLNPTPPLTIIVVEFNMAATCPALRKSSEELVSEE
jgi:hypothetical protein